MFNFNDYPQNLDREVHTPKISAYTKKFTKAYSIQRMRYTTKNMQMELEQWIK